MKNCNYLDTSLNHPFLLKFKNSSTKYFINPDDLGAFLYARKELFLDSIKEYNAAKDNFKIVSKTNLKIMLSWNTEALEELKRRNFIK
ncbi:MAG: hypothetical protein AB8G11_09635 [Saprospiraceae bacterium]